MSYDHTIPNAANVVRGTSGDLQKMRDNFEELAAAASGLIQTGSAPNDYLDGWVYGDDQFRIVASGDELLFQKNDSGWATIAYIPVGGQWVFSGTASGVTPTEDAHLATKGYVDTVSAALSGEVASVPDTLSGLADTAVSGASGGQALVFSASSSKWEPLAYTLSALTDTVVSGVTSGQALVYDGTEWVPGSVATQLTVEEGDGSPSVSGVSRLVASGLNGITVTVVSSAEGEATVTISGDAHENLTQVTGEEQGYPTGGPHLLSGLSGVTPPGAPISGGTAYAATFSAAIRNDGGSAADFAVRIHVGSNGDETDAVQLRLPIRRGAGITRQVAIPEAPITIASGETVSVTVSGGQAFSVLASGDRKAWLRLRDGVAVGAGAGGGGGSSTLSGLTDVDADGPPSGAHLVYGGSSWEDRGFIRETQLTASGITMTVSGIPQTAQLLEVFVLVRTDAGGIGDSCMMQFNGDTGNNYNSVGRTRQSDGTGADATKQGTNVDGIAVRACGGSAPANSFATNRYSLPFYASGQYLKSCHGDGARLLGNGANDMHQTIYGGCWENVSGITSITVRQVNDSSNMVSGCRILVRGVA